MMVKKPNDQTMRTAIITLLLLAFLDGNGSGLYAQMTTTAPYHVMWTNAKGKAKCKNKASKEKADKCAAKLRTKALTEVQVMAGKCSTM
jgi:hypothetical protein